MMFGSLLALRESTKGDERRAGRLARGDGQAGSGKSALPTGEVLSLLTLLVLLVLLALLALLFLV